MRQFGVCVRVLSNYQKKKEIIIKIVETRMLRLMSGVTKSGRNSFIRSLRITDIARKTRENRSRRFGRVERKNNDEISER